MVDTRKPQDSFYSPIANKVFLLNIIFWSPQASFNITFCNLLSFFFTYIWNMWLFCHMLLFWEYIQYLPFLTAYWGGREPTNHEPNIDKLITLPSTNIENVKDFYYFIIHDVLCHSSSVLQSLSWLLLQNTSAPPWLGLMMLWFLLK